ncbi:50S ribosomal protein L2 [Candidatus Woesearchaeota archaeon]|nr:50S ribosomal protein L2 [Candidatus Woesearchaeota archaeon]
MGKNLIQQKRGKGSPTYRAPSFRYAGEARYPKADQKAEGRIIDIVHSQGHSAPLMVVKYGQEYCLNIAPEGIKVGQSISYGSGSEIKEGNSLELNDIPEGTPIFNIESRPGDGGKFVRSSGASARVISKTKDKVVVRLPSKRQKEFSARCLATIGNAAGSGRTEKPFLKAGNKYYKMKAKNKLWPSVGGVSMNAVDHPFGGKASHTKGRPTQAPKNAPPGRKVGKIAPKRTGKKNR